MQGGLCFSARLAGLCLCLFSLGYQFFVFQSAGLHALDLVDDRIKAVVVCRIYRTCTTGR